MFNNVVDKIKKINKTHPYLMRIVIFIIASLIGITIQYLIDGRIIASGFYTASFIAIASLISTWIKRRT